MLFITRMLCCAKRAAAQGHTADTTMQYVKKRDEQGKVVYSAVGRMRLVKGKRCRWKAHLAEKRGCGEHAENLPVEAVEQGKPAHVAHGGHGQVLRRSTVTMRFEC